MFLFDGSWNFNCFKTLVFRDFLQNNGGSSLDTFPKSHIILPKFLLFFLKNIIKHFSVLCCNQDILSILFPYYNKVVSLSKQNTSIILCFFMVVNFYFFLEIIGCSFEFTIKKFAFYYIWNISKSCNWDYQYTILESLLYSFSDRIFSSL